MSVKRQQSLLGQMRLEVPHLRSLESAVAADFDVLAGQMLAGGAPAVVQGFEVVVAGAAASSLQLVTAGGVLIHPTATDAGSIFTVSASEAVQTLNEAVNSKVLGGFTANADNYVSVDLLRRLDTTTSAEAKFLNPVTNTEVSRIVPMARVLDYVIVIDTIDPSTLPNLCPLARVAVDSSGAVTAVEDLRPMLFRLAPGGVNGTLTEAYTWPLGRAPETTSTFTGGDKALGSLRDAVRAILTRLWELGGGERWFSATSDRDVKLCFGNDPAIALSNGDNFLYDDVLEQVSWQNLFFVFANSTAVTNTINDDTDVDIADGQCIYVDIDRETDGQALTMQVADLETLGSPTVPGSRYVIGWRVGDEMFFRDKQYEAGRQYNTVATTGAPGTVLLEYAGETTPVVTPREPTTGTVKNTADSSGSAGFEGTGAATGVGVGVKGIGGATSGAGVRGVASAGNSAGVEGVPHGTGNGVDGVTTSSGAGVKGRSSSSGAGVLGTTTSSGAAVKGESTTSTGFGGHFTATAGTTVALVAASTGGTGATLTGGGAGAGVLATGGATGNGVVGNGGSTSGAGGVFTASAGNNHGAEGYGSGTGAGVFGSADSASGADGVRGRSSSTAGSYGVKAESTGSGKALWADGAFDLEGGAVASTVTTTTGDLEVSTTSGDLDIASSAGPVSISAGTDVTMLADDDVVINASGEVQIANVATSTTKTVTVGGLEGTSSTVNVEINAGERVVAGEEYTAAGVRTTTVGVATPGTAPAFQVYSDTTGSYVRSPAMGEFSITEQTEDNATPTTVLSKVLASATGNFYRVRAVLFVTGDAGNTDDLVLSLHSTIACRMGLRCDDSAAADFSDSATSVNVTVPSFVATTKGLVLEAIVQPLTGTNPVTLSIKTETVATNTYTIKARYMEVLRID